VTEPMPPQPSGAAGVRPEDGPQDVDLDDLDGQARQVDEQLEEGED
jgi:hypothetical protein